MRSCNLRGSPTKARRGTQSPVVVVFGGRGAGTALSQGGQGMTWCCSSVSEPASRAEEQSR
ncbi:Hypothetical predicted protein, partial [Xyrichtys novacula]